VYDVLAALDDGAASIHEARVAMAMAVEGELKGFRHIEEASGLTDDSLLKVIPGAGASTTLLTCTNRGRFAYEEEERRPMSLSLRRYRPDTGHNWSSSSNTPYDQGSRGSKDLEDGEVVEEKTSGVRRLSKDALALLDPSLDIWMNATEGCADREEFGDTGWALAVATRMEPTELALDEISRITRVGERQTRRIIDRLVRRGWARKIREGRRVRIVVDFSMMLHEDHRDDYLKHSRRARKALIHQHEGKVLKRLGTKVGRLVRDIWRNKHVEIRMFLDWAKEAGGRCFDRIISILSWKNCKEDPRNGISRWVAEQALFEYFRPYLHEEGLTA